MVDYVQKVPILEYMDATRKVPTVLEIQRKILNICQWQQAIYIVRQIKDKILVTLGPTF